MGAKSSRGRLTLDASGSSDPDGDGLRYQWVHYPEPGNYWERRGITLVQADSAVISF